MLGGLFKNSNQLTSSNIVLWGIGAGLLQVAYTFFVVLILVWLSDNMAYAHVNDVFASLFILLLLVFSVGISGVIVFGLPVYAILQKQTVPAYRLLAITLVTILIAAIVAYAIGSITV